MPLIYMDFPASYCPFPSFTPNFQRHGVKLGKMPPAGYPKMLGKPKNSLLPSFKKLGVNLGILTKTWENSKLQTVYNKKSA